MRIFMTMTTLVGLLCITTVNADVPKKEDVPKNINILKTSASAKARALAADELGRCGALRASWVEDAIDPIITAMKKDKDATVRKACCKALGDTGIEAEKCVAALIEALGDTSADVKMAAAQALGQFGAQAKSALPTLNDLKKNKDDKKLTQAVQAAIQSISGVGKKK